MPPPSEFADPPNKKVRVIVSSAERNVRTYPSPSDYVITFNEPFTDVTSMTLLSASVPLVAYQVSAANDELAFEANGNTQYAVTIPHGDYSPTDLAAMLTALMNGAVAIPLMFSVEYVPRTDGFTFKSSGSFKLLFAGGTAAYGPQIQGEFSTLTPTGIVETIGIAGDSTILYRPKCAARILGFGPNTYSATYSNPEGAWIVQSAYRRDATSQASSAVLYVDGADVNQSTSDALNRCFAVIGPQQTSMEYWTPDRMVVKSYHPPIGKFAKLHVRVRDLFGNPYDCQNHDHRLEILFTCAPKYQSRPNWTVRSD